MIADIYKFGGIVIHALSFFPRLSTSRLYFEKVTFNNDELFSDHDELLNLIACYSYFWFVFDHLGHAPWVDNKHFKKGNNGREAQITNGE